jgi:hypothetical protein
LNTAFRHTLEQTWPSANSNRHRRGGKVPAVNAKPLLGALIRKYSHYGDYGQQDGHELLVHLLDAMRMEEMDLIKKLQPATPSARRRPRPSRTATLAMTAQVEEEAHTPRATARADPLHALAPLPEEPKMRPFVDAVFGGKLLSAVVCEGCRHVSHTVSAAWASGANARHGAGAVRLTCALSVRGLPRCLAAGAARVRHERRQGESSRAEGGCESSH